MRCTRTACALLAKGPSINNDTAGIHAAVLRKLVPALHYTYSCGTSTQQCNAAGVAAATLAQTNFHKLIERYTRTQSQTETCTRAMLRANTASDLDDNAANMLQTK